MYRFRDTGEPRNILRVVAGQAEPTAETRSRCLRLELVEAKAVNDCSFLATRSHSVYSNDVSEIFDTVCSKSALFEFEM